MVETAFGYEIVKVDQRTERRTATLEEAREYVRNLLKEQNRQKATVQFLDTVAKEAGLEVAAAPAAETKPAP